MIRATGIDISKWDYPYTPKLVDFIIQRLSYGMMKDERITELTPQALSAPVKGAYHYYSSGSPWKSQAALFLSLADGKYDFLALDVEKLYNVASSAFVDGVAQTMDYLKTYGYKPVVLYVNPDIWNTWLYPVQKDLVKYDIWLAQYWFIRAASNPSVPKTLTQGWKFWQWNDRPYDQDVFNGTLDDLQMWAHPVAYKVCPTCGGTGRVPA
jgi:GH25 family lysozyme M1 (1,4-beta-N-acetylmuramidase)